MDAQHLLDIEADLGPELALRAIQEGVAPFEPLHVPDLPIEEGRQQCEGIGLVASAGQQRNPSARPRPSGGSGRKRHIAEWRRSRSESRSPRQRLVKELRIDRIHQTVAGVSVAHVAMFAAQIRASGKDESGVDAGFGSAGKSPQRSRIARG